VISTPRKVAIYLIFACSPCLACELPGGEESLQQLLNGIQSLNADFEQTLYSSDNQLIQQSTGQLAMKRPGLLRWKNDAPFEEIVVADGERLWFYEPELEQVTVRSAASNLINTPAMLLIGDADNLDQDYQVYAQQLLGGKSCYRLVPTENANLFSKIELMFHQQTPQTMHLWDDLGQKTAIDLNNITINGELASGLFVFAPPEGVDILRDD